jgi:hypothetical protein
MKKVVLLVAAAGVVGFAGSALAGKDSAPGQDKVCLTTAIDDSGADISILSAQWLPRKAADKQLAKGVGHANGENAKIYEYVDNGLTARETCLGLNPGGVLNPD